MGKSILGCFLAIVFSLPPGSMQGQTVSTFAGNYFGDGLDAGYGRLLSVTGITFDPSGNMYLTDNTANRVRKVNISNVISTFAGNGAIGGYDDGGYSGDGGPATSAEMYFPYGIARDNSGNIYIAEQNNHVVRKITPAGIISTFAGTGSVGYSGDGGAATAAELSYPTGVAVDDSGNVFIGCNGSIRKVNTLGIISTVAGNGVDGASDGDGGPATSAHVGLPTSISFDPSGNLIFFDLMSVVRKIDRSTGIITTILAGYGMFNGTLDHDGNIYVCDGSLVRKIDTSGGVTIFAGNGDYGTYGDGGLATDAAVSGPGSVYADAAGNVYIGCDNGTVRKVNSSGVISTVVGGGRVTGGNFYSGDGPATQATFRPNGVAADGLGNVYISDLTNNYVLKIHGGAVTHIAGTGMDDYSGDGGPAISAGISQPYGIAADSIGNVYIADVGNSAIRKIDTAGNINTIASFLAYYVSVDRAGNVYASTSSDVVKIDPSGILTTIAGNGIEGYDGDGGLATSAQLSHPTQVVFDRAGNMYIADLLNSRLRKVDTSGIITTVAGTGALISDGDGGPATAAALPYPMACVIDSNDNIYVGSANIMRKIDASGIISTYAGTDHSGYYGDGGPASEAWFTDIFHAAIDYNGRLYLAEYSSQVVRVIDAGFPPITGASSVCVGGSITVADAVGGGIWSSSNTSIATVGSASGIVSGLAAGTTTISYVTSSGTATTIVTVTGSTVASITGSMTVCTGNTTTLANATAGGAWSSSNTAIATVGSATGVVSGVAAGNASITYTVISGCGTAMATAVVTVSNAPSAGTITGTATVCAGNTTTLSNATTGGTWISSNTSVATVGSTTGVVSGVAAGNATITYSVTSGCGTATATAVVTVNSTPSAGTITGTATVCTGNTTTLNNATSGGTWSSSNTSIATIGSATGIVSGVAAGNATITYTVSNGCGNATATKVVTVNAATSAGAITGAGSVCTGATTTLSNTTTGGAWSSSNPSVASVGSSTGVVSGVGSGNATITYTVSGACGAATATKVVTIGVTASIAGALSLCAGMTSTLSGGASGGAWSSSNTAVATVGATSGVLTAVATGTANITYSLGSGCTATAVASISQPAIIGGTSNACVGQTAVLTDATTGGAWSSSNTSLATVDASTGVVTGVAAGTATVSYIVSAGCYRTIAFTVKALPPAIAGPVTVCEGSTVYVTPPSSNGQSWTSSNTSVATIGSSSNILTGVSAGTTTLTYTTIPGCFVTTVVTVNAAPAAITGTTALCSGSTSSLSSATTGGAWSSSNTSVATIGSATGVLTAVNAGIATITYNAGACSRTTIVTVSPIAAIAGTPSMCVGASATLSDATTGGTWSSSNTGVATVGMSGIVTGIASGNATITYTLASGCSRTVTATVVSTPGVITGTLSVCPAGTTALGNAATGGTWHSTNSSIASINMSTGVLTGVGAGTTNVTYTLGTGCRTISVATVNPQPAVIAGTTNACVAQTATLTDATAGGTWSSNNTSIATVDPSTGIVTGVSAATTTMTYTLGTGCFRTSAFTVKALPPAVASPVAACVGTTTSIAPPSTNGKSWTSSNTTVATMGSSSGIFTGVSTGTTTLTYTTITGCYVTIEATVYALPSAGTITGPTSVIVGSTITLNDAAGGGVWSSSNTARATIGSATGIVTGVAGGTATVSYSVSNPGCTVRATQVISALTSRPGGNGDATVSNFQLYPNPTTGAFTVEVEEAGTFSIFSLDGREVSRYNISEGATQLSLSKELASGIYMCRYTSESGSITMVRLVYER